MQTIDLADLLGVTGGCQSGQQPQQQQDPSAQTQVTTGSTGGADILGGLQQVLGFFQSDSFQQLLAGIQGLIGQAGQGNTSSTQQPTAQA